MSSRALRIVTLALLLTSCAPTHDVDAPRCDVHDRALVPRHTTVDTTTSCGIPIDGYDEAHAASFPNTFERPTRGEHGAATTAEHCVACTFTRAAWLDTKFGRVIPADRDGFVDVRRSIGADPSAVAEALDVTLAAHGRAIAARSFDDRMGYARIGDADAGVTDIWWDDALAAGATDVAIRTSPHDASAARALVDALVAELASAR